MEVLNSCFIAFLECDELFGGLVIIRPSCLLGHLLQHFHCRVCLLHVISFWNQKRLQPWMINDAGRQVMKHAKKGIVFTVLTPICPSIRLSIYCMNYVV